MTDRRPYASAAPVARANNNHTGANHNNATTTAAPVWHACPHCTSTPTFQTTADFVRHLQTKHCTRLDAPSISPNSTKQFVCRFGPGGTCSRLNQQRRTDLDGCDADDDDEYADDRADTFEQHVLRHHLSPIVKRKVSTASNRSVSSAQIFGGGPATQQQNSTETTDSADWTIFSSTQNLPAVLNDPSRGKQTTLFTKKWGDTFVEKTTIPPSPYLAEVTYGDLDAYLQRIGKRFRRHQRLKMMAITSSASEGGQPSSETLETNAGDHISDIPAIFLHQQLQLNDPTIFAQVFPGLEATKKALEIDDDDAAASADAVTAARASAVAAGATARLHLQEKLSHYLDVVEVHITRKVSQQSGAFFAAMTSQHTIVAEMHAAMLNVRRLRQQIATADATLVRNALHICATRRRQQNQAYVVHKLKIMAEVHKTQPMIQLLLGTADYVAAIDLIGSTQELLARELRDVHCLKHLPSQLHEMERLIDKMLRTEFERFATADLNRRHAELADAESADVAAALPAVEDEEKLVSIVWGLLRQRNFSFIDTYRDEAIVTVRALIKEMLIEVLASGDADSCLTGDGEESQSLSIGEWIQLLDGATVRLLRLLRRVRAIVGVMRRIAAQSAGRPTTVEDVGFYRNEAFLSAAELQRVDGRLVELMHTICNYCHERCATLISSQSLERSVATAGQIERLQRIVRTFSAGCEVLTGGGGAGGADAMVCLPLLAALKAQATRFAQKFHADRKAKLALLLDSERWRQTEVPAEIQRLVTAIAAGRWTQQPQQGNANEIDRPEKTTGVALLVGDDAYVLCGSALILLQIVDEYARCAAQLPVVAAQLARHVVDLLRTFNSRCCQLVLGAGALRVAGLKTITSANLALVARALQLVVWLLPYIRGHFQRAADGRQQEANPAVSDATTTVVQNGNGVHTANHTSGYDIVERDLLSHIAEIETMILSIVTQLVHSQLDAWTARPPVPSPSFRNISRHFVKLHEALAPIMPAAQVQRIYAVVHRTFKDKLREQLQRHGVVNNGGPAHGVVTAELTFYTETVRTLGVFDGADVDELGDEAMADVWRK